MVEALVKEVKGCRVCEPFLEHGVNPVLSVHPKSKIVIIGQAPGSKVHESGAPWQDKSGERLRTWLNVTVEQFYNPEIFAILPMGFCYPGKGNSGDLPPRPECAPLWHKSIRSRADNDAYHFFDALGDLIRTGPTGTNVNDLLSIFAF